MRRRCRRASNSLQGLDSGGTQRGVRAASRHQDAHLHAEEAIEGDRPVHELGGQEWNQRRLGKGGQDGRGDVGHGPRRGNGGAEGGCPPMRSADDRCCSTRLCTRSTWQISTATLIRPWSLHPSANCRVGRQTVSRAKCSGERHARSSTDSAASSPTTMICHYRRSSPLTCQLPHPAKMTLPASVFPIHHTHVGCGRRRRHRCSPQLARISPRTDRETSERLRRHPPRALARRPSRSPTP